jgi:hypothetical protein
MGNDLPGFHGKYKVFWSLAPPLKSRLYLWRIIKCLLDFDIIKIFIINMLRFLIPATPHFYFWWHIPPNCLACQVS